MRTANSTVRRSSPDDPRGAPPTPPAVLPRRRTPPGSARRAPFFAVGLGRAAGRGCGADTPGGRASQIASFTSTISSVIFGELVVVRQLRTDLVLPPPRSNCRRSGLAVRTRTRPHHTGDHARDAPVLAHAQFGLPHRRKFSLTLPRRKSPTSANRSNNARRCASSSTNDGSVIALSNLVRLIRISRLAPTSINSNHLHSCPQGCRSWPGTTTVLGSSHDSPRRRLSRTGCTWTSASAAGAVWRLRSAGSRLTAKWPACSRPARRCPRCTTPRSWITTGHALRPRGQRVLRELTVGCLS